MTSAAGLLMRFRCVRLERHAVTVLPAHGVHHTEERQTVTLAPISAKSATHPNRRVWAGGLAAGELRIEELLPDLVGAHFRLGGDYVVELRPVDTEHTKKI